MRPPLWRLFYYRGGLMNLFVYSDESGVFDRVHNDIFVFGGLIFINGKPKNIAARKFIHAESCLRQNGNHTRQEELKACKITPTEKNKLFRSLNEYYKFGVVVKQKKLIENIFSNKKSRQRYLDYAYKIALKKELKNLFNKDDLQKIKNIKIYVDEHTTATNGRYELQEAIEQEFKIGTFNYNYNCFYDPILPNIDSINLSYCNSRSVTLIRAADIVANKIYYNAVNNNISELNKKPNFFITQLP